MFEPATAPPTGRIEVICGPMFSGKTEELIYRIRKAGGTAGSVMLFKPAIDVRFSTHEIVSHDNTRANCTPVTSAHEIVRLAAGADVIGIDEAQFLDEGLPEVINRLAGAGARVILAGLDMDFRGVPFGPMPRLMAIAEEVYKLKAVCESCGRPASYTHRLSPAEETILLGEGDIYTPRCRGCFGGGRE